MLTKNITIPPYTNSTCDYTKSNDRSRYFKCGDKCIYWNASCQCGSLTLKPWRSEEYCYIPDNYTCLKTARMQGFQDVVCKRGTVLPVPISHNNSERVLHCYDNNQGSENVNYWSFVQLMADMCGGIRWCDSDVRSCGPQLQCPYDDFRVATRLTSSLLPHHRTCVFDLGAKENNEEYDMLDRSDEKMIRSELVSLDINVTFFRPCQFFNINPGIMCGGQCVPLHRFCSKDSGGSYGVTCTPELINNSDRRLCSNPLVWRNAEVKAKPVFILGTCGRREDQ